MLLARQKTMLATVMVCALIIILSTAAYIFSSDHIGRQELSPRVSDTFAGLIQTQLSQDQQNAYTLQSMLEQITQYYQVQEAALYNQDGQRLMHSYRSGPTLSASLPGNLNIPDTHKYSLHSKQGEMTLFIVSDLSLPVFFIFDTLTTGLFVLCVSALLIFALYSLTRHWQKHPYQKLLRNIQQATRAIGKDQNIHIPVNDPDFKPLTKALNDLLWQHNQRTLNLRNAHQQAESARLRATQLSTETRQINEHLAQEISVRRGVETQLNNTRHLLNDIINAMPSALFTLDDELRIVKCNKQAGDWLGLPYQQLAGRHLLPLLPELETISDDLFNTADTHQTIRKKERIDITSFIQPLKTDLIVYPLVAQQQARQVLRIDDISQRQQLEEIMVHSEKMATVAGLATGIAHEINNPLGAILQNLQNIRRRLQPGLTANQAAAESAGLSITALEDYLQRRDIGLFMNNIQQAGERAAGIVTNMLQFSRPDQQYKQRRDLNTLVADSLMIARGDSGLRDLTLDFQPDTEPVWVEVLTNEIEQVLLNILQNAEQALQQNSETMRTLQSGWNPLIRLRTFYKNGLPTLMIEDNGCGIPKDQQSHIFEPFYTTKEVGKGTGLGLFLSYFIVTSHHQGSIRYFSSALAGAGFEICLPAVTEKNLNIT